MVLFLLDPLTKTAIVAALASSVFLVFVMPWAKSSTPKNLMGGHLVACIVAGLYVLLVGRNSILFQARFLYISSAIVVSVTLLSMALLNIAHAPACGTAFGLIIHGWDWRMVIFILTATILLSGIRAVFSKQLKNLV